MLMLMGWWAGVWRGALMLAGWWAGVSDRGAHSCACNLLGNNALSVWGRVVDMSHVFCSLRE